MSKIPQSTRLRLENKHTYGKIFQWKTDHPETVKPIRTRIKVESTDNEDTNKMTAVDFLPSFSQFNEGIRQINESKVPKWMEAKIKTKEINISNDDR